jgi:hypothetical protein
MLLAQGGRCQGKNAVAIASPMIQALKPPCILKLAEAESAATGFRNRLQ